MTTSPVILNDTILSNGSMAVLAGDPYKQSFGNPFNITYYGFTNLQVAIISANNSPVTLNQSSGNLSFASAGDSPNGSVSSPGDGGDETTGGGTLLGLPNGDIAVVTWGNPNHNYDLQILNSSGGVVTAPFVLANDLAGPSPIEGNPFATIATNGSEFVVAWNTDDITGLYFERFSLTGTPIGGVVTVKAPSANNPNFGNTNSGFGGSLAIDDQGNVILGFSAEDVYHTGYYEMFNSSNAVVTTTTSQLISTSGVGGNSVTLKNEDLAPHFVPVAGGGFLTAGYVPNGVRNSDGTYTNFGLYVQQVATNGSISTPSTTANVLPGGFQDPGFGLFVELSNGSLAFQESGASNASVYNPSTTTLTRNTLSIPAVADNATLTNPGSYLFVPTPIANVSGGGLAGLSVNSSNQLVATGLDTAPAPVITAGATATFDGGGSAVTLDSGLTVTDTGSTTLVGATVSVGTGFVSGDTLNFTNQNGITGSYNSGTGVLTLSGTTTLANYQTALDSITYSFSPANGDPTGGGSHTSRTINWSANDGTANSNTANSTLNVVHEPPVAVAGASVSYEVGAAAKVLDSGLTVSDPDSGGNLSSATVSIGTGFHAGDTLAFTNQNGITGSYNSGTGVLTLSGTASVANYQTALESITFSGATTTGSRTVHWTVNDGVSGSTDVTSTVTVTGAPSVTAGATATFDGGGSAVLLDSGLTLSDPSNANLSSATVSIATGFLAGDTINFVNQNGITGSYDSGTGVLTLSGTTTLANYQTALDSITYGFSPANGDPTGGGGDTSRTIHWSVSDGAASSATVSSTLNTVHEPPVVTAGAAVSYGTGGAPAVLDAGLTAADPDSAGNLSSATVSVGTGFVVGDTLNFTNQNGIVGSYNSGTGVLTLSGTSSIANYQTALESVAFTSTSNSAGSRTIHWTVNDGVSGSTDVTSTVNVTVGPQLAAGATVAFTGGGPAVALDSTLTVTDAESTTLANATVLINTGFLTGDTLNFSNQNGITGSYNAATGVLSLTGTASLADYQTALDSITYGFNPANGDPTNGGADLSRTIEWLANDGINPSPAATSTLNVAHVAPSVTAGATAIFNGGGAAVTLDSTLSVSDPDSGGNLASATVTIVGFLAGDLLNFTNQGGITGSYNAATGVLTLSGTASLANYQTALDSITYGFNPANGDPTGGGSHTTRTIQWTANDGAATSAPATSTLNVAHVAPSVTAGATATFHRGGTPVTLDSTLSVSDPDSGGNLVGGTVSIVGFLAGDLLDFTNQGGISGSYNAATGVLTLSGTASLAAYQTALDSISYDFSPSGGDPTNGGTDPSRTIQWVANDGAATSAPATSLVLMAPPTSDFNGDGESDVLFQNTNSLIGIWEMNGVNIVNAGIPGSGPGWQAIGTGDFNGDGKSDILFQNAGGQVGIWEMNSFSIIGTGIPGSGPGWKAIGTGDFNGDGKSDILFQNANGTVGIWEMNGLNVIGSGNPGSNPGPSWQVIGTGDFNGDGKSDILFQNTNGTVGIWEMNGLNIIGTGTPGGNPGPSWKAIGTGDFNGDGMSDILFQNTNGTVGIWEMNGVNFLNSGSPQNPGPSWQVIGTGDYNGDGKSDILFQNTNGTVGIWEMNGFNIIGSGTPQNPGASWHALP